MEMMQTPLKQQLDIIYRPHPLLPAADCQHKQQAWKPGQTVREILLANGVDPHQLIVIVLDDRLLTVTEWDTVCPQPGQIINVKAEVAGGGGDGGSNALQIVAMIALVIVVSYFTLGTGTMSAASLFGVQAGGAAAAAMGGVIAIAGSLVINAVFAANVPGLNMGDASGTYSQASPTYSLSGGQNRTRPYESMPVIMGTHRHVPDNGAKPFTEYHGEDQYLYQVFHLGLSTCDRSDWRIGTNPIGNYTDYTWSYPNSAGQLTGFPGNVDSTPGSTLTHEAGWVVRTSSSDTYRLGIDIEGTLYYANNGGGLDATSVQLRVQYCPAGTGAWQEPSYISISGAGFANGYWWTHDIWVSSGEYNYAEDGTPYWIDTSHTESRTDFVGGGGIITLSGASQAPRRATLFIDVPTGTYDVRVIRDTGDTTDARLQNKTNWSTLRSYQNDTATYAGQSRQGIAIRASEQLNGTISQMSYLAEAYASYWNGTAWAWGKTSNPAHWFADFARGRRDANGRLLYGIGLTDDQIDLAALAAWANFCRSEGLSFNAVIDRTQTAADMLTAICRCGFASPTWASGKLGVIWDARNAAPTMAFGMSNIIKDSFEISYITEQLAEEIIVRYVNPAKDWQQDEVRVTVPGITSPARSSSIDLYGCTDTAMAGKFANYMAAQQFYRKRRIQWESDFEGFVCQRGDVVLLSHDLTQWGYSGRVVSIDGAVVTLDRQVPRAGGIDYLMLKRPDGSMETYTVAAGTGNSDTVTLTTAPELQADCLPMDHIWMFSPLPTPGKKIKIISISPISDSRLQIIATDEAPQFYAAWDGAWQAAPNQTLLAPSVPVIADLKISERLTVIGAGQILTRVTFSWQQKTSQVERIELRYRINQGAWLTASVLSGQSYDVDFDGFGLVEVSALPINGLFQGSKLSASANVYGKTLPPENVQAFATDPLASRFTLRWNPVGDIDLAGYQIRWINGDSRDWGQAAPIHDGLVVSSPYISVTRPAGYGTLMIKAVDTSGNYSVAPAAIVVDLGDAPINNVILAVDVAADGFVGTLSNCHLVDGAVLADEQGTMWNPNDKASMWHLDSDAMWRAATYFPMAYSFVVDTPAHALGSNLTLPATVNGDSWSIQYRPLGASKMWVADGEGMWNADTDPMWTLPPPFMPWPGSITASVEQYEFKIDISFGGNRGEISALVASFDVPDVNETLVEIPISASGTRLPIVKSYFGIRAVNLTLLAGTTAAFFARVIDKDPITGPLIQCYDVTGNPVDGLIDANTYGY